MFSGMKPWLWDLLIGFSLYSNTRKLLNAKAPSKPSEHLTCMNGIRFMSMSWVLLCHAIEPFQIQLPITNVLSLYDVSKLSI
jgi:hypothetical protein